MYMHIRQKYFNKCSIANLIYKSLSLKKKDIITFNVFI